MEKDIMSKVRTIEIHENIFADNLNEAQNIRENLNKSNTLLINVMSSPGSGKTTTISKVINQLKSKYKIAVLDVDIESDLDAQTIADNTGVDSIQINNGGLPLVIYRYLQTFGESTLSSDVHKKTIEQALLRYCELDTMAMVLVWEYFAQVCGSLYR